MRKIHLLAIAIFAIRIAHAQNPVSVSSDLNVQPPNCVVAGPASGSSAVPTCRQLVQADVNAVIPAVQTGADKSIITPGPVANIESSIFATGWTVGATTYPSCVGVNGNTTGYADPTGTANSRCPIQSAYAYSVAYAAANPGTGYMPVYYPHGQFLCNNPTGYAACVEVDYPISSIGDSDASSILYNTSPYAAALSYVGLNTGCNQTDLFGCNVEVRNLRIIGTGHLGIGDGLSVLDVTGFSMWDSTISNVGGCSINVNGSSERGLFMFDDVINSNCGVNTGEGNNETYFYRVNLDQPGTDATGWCFSLVNCTGGVLNAGVWYPEPFAAVRLGGDSVQWVDSSIKSLGVFSGIQVKSGAANIKLDGGYLEGYPTSSGSPRLNTSIIVVGKSEIGHLASAITTTALTVPLLPGEAIRQPLWYTDPAYSTSTGVEAQAGSNNYLICPQDASWGSTAASSYVTGVTRGTCESVSSYGTAADGAAHLGARGSTPIAWPAGSLYIKAQQGTYGTIAISHLHINGDTPYTFASTYSAGCNDTLRLPVTTPGTVFADCADIIAGIDPDGISVPVPGQGPNYSGTRVTLSGNSFYTSGTGTTSQQEVLGQGWIKVPSNASVSFDDGDNIPPSSAWSISQLQGGTYLNNITTRFQFVNWGSGNFPDGVFTDPGAGVSFTAFPGTFGGFIGNFMDSSNNGAVATMRVGPQSNCQYGGNNSGVFGVEDCLYNNGEQISLWNGTAWAQAFNVTSSAVTITDPVSITGTVTSTGAMTAPAFHGVADSVLSAGAQTLMASGTISSSARVVFLVNETGSPMTATLNTCNSSIANEQHDIIQQTAGASLSNTVTLSAPGQLQVNGTITGLASSSTTMPGGAHWFVKCDSSTNGYLEWRASTNWGPASLASVTLDASQSGSATITPDSHELSGSFALTLSAAATAHAALAEIAWSGVDRIYPNYCHAETAGSASVTLGASLPSATGTTIYAPAGLAAGTYTVAYECPR